MQRDPAAVALAAGGRDPAAVALAAGRNVARDPVALGRARVSVGVYVPVYTGAERERLQPLVMFYATELLRSVEAMHGTGILHCDIKPDNILLRDDDETDTAWIYSPSTGFGAKVLICLAFWLPSSHARGLMGLSDNRDEELSTPQPNLGVDLTHWCAFPLITGIAAERCRGWR